jgi:hypothetical protein
VSTTLDQAASHAAKTDFFLAYLAARDLVQDLLIAYSEDIYRGEGASLVRKGEVNRQFRELANRLGFTIEQKQLEAAE